MLRIPDVVVASGHEVLEELVSGLRKPGTHLFIAGIQVKQLVPAGCLNQIPYAVGCRLELPLKLVSLQPVPHLHGAAVKFSQT